MKKGMLWLAAAAVGLAAWTAEGGEAEAQTTLRVGSWLPPHHLIMTGIIQPWAKAIEAETDGDLRFEIMTSALGPPPAYFDLMLDGAVDVGYGVSGHNPGRFTMTQVMDLPFLAPDPWSGAAAAWLTYQRYGESYGEHEGAKVVGLFVHSTPAIHMRGEPIRSLADLEGKRIRVGGNVTGNIISQLGGTPVQLPPTEAQTAMSRGVADGITFPMESIPFFGITPVIESTTEIPGGLYTDTFWIAINQETWDGLSEEQQAAVEKHSGMAIALLSGWAWSDADANGRMQMEEAGVEFVTLPEEEIAVVKERLAPLEEEWLAQADGRGLPGQEILDYAREMVEQYRPHKAAAR